MRYTVYLILLSSLCVDGIAEDQKIEYQNFAPEDLVYTFVFQSTGLKPIWDSLVWERLERFSHACLDCIVADMTDGALG